MSKPPLRSGFATGVCGIMILKQGENMKAKAIFILFLTLITNISYAGTPPFQGCSGTGCIGKLENIYLNPNGTVQVPPMGSNSSNLDCNLGDGLYLTLKKEHIHFKEMYSMLLAAHAAQKDIFLRTVINSNDCEIWYSVIY